MSNNSNSTNKKVNQQADKNVIKTKVFTELYTDDKDINDQAKARVERLYKDEKSRCLYFGDITQKGDFKHSLIGIVDYNTFRRNKEESDLVKHELIYRVDKTDDKYSVVAGKYCGFLSLPFTYYNKPVQLEISCGYSDRFFKRILDFCCGIYVNDNPFGGEKTTKSINTILSREISATKRYIIKRLR